MQPILQKEADMITRRALLRGTLVFISGRTLLSQGALAQKRCGSRTRLGSEQIYHDERGLIVQQDCDGGDTAQREGWYWLGTWARASKEVAQPWAISRQLPFEDVMSQLEIGQSGTF